MCSFYCRGDNMSGILKHFYTSNIEKYFDIVKTYTTSEHDNRYISKYAIDFDDNNYWHAKENDKRGNYLVIYLRDYYIKLKGYSIKTSVVGPGTGTAHPKNWGFDASLDNRTWEHQENITDDGTMNNILASRYLKWSYGTYKYFRLMITGSQYDSYDKNSIDLNQIELFGKLITLDPAPCTCQASRHSFLYSIIIIILCNS